MAHEGGFPSDMLARSPGTGAVSDRAGDQSLQCVQFVQSSGAQLGAARPGGGSVVPVRAIRAEQWSAAWGSGGCNRRPGRKRGQDRRRRWSVEILTAQTSERAVFPHASLARASAGSDLHMSRRLPWPTRRPSGRWATPSSSGRLVSSLCWGPGSVGLSRYTAPVEAMYGGKNHCMFASKTILGAGNKSPRCRLV